MKKTVNFPVFILAAFMMLSFCSCNSGNTNTGSSDGSIGESSAESSDEAPDESSGDNVFSGNVTGSVMYLMYDVIGKDQETAEIMIGEFFDVELNDSLGNMVTDERDGIVTKMHVYKDMFVKDSVRFNGLQIWTDDEDGHVRRVEFVLDNSGIITVPIDDTPEFQSEIKSLYEDVYGELNKSLGQPKNSGVSMGNDWVYYQISNDLFASVEVIDYTEPGGNGTVATSVVFADAEVLV